MTDDSAAMFQIIPAARSNPQKTLTLRSTLLLALSLSGCHAVRQDAKETSFYSCLQEVIDAAHSAPGDMQSRNRPHCTKEVMAQYDAFYLPNQSQQTFFLLLYKTPHDYLFLTDALESEVRNSYLLVLRRKGIDLEGMDLSPTRVIDKDKALILGDHSKFTAGKNLRPVPYPGSRLIP